MKLDASASDATPPSESENVDNNESKEPKASRSRENIEADSDVPSPVLEPETSVNSIKTDQLKVALKDSLDSQLIMSEDFIEKLATKVAGKVFQLQNQSKVTVTEQEFDEYWKEYTDYIVCTPCSLYHKRSDVPAGLRSSIRKGFGIIQKEKIDSNKQKRLQKKHHLTRSKKHHCGLALHDWCVSKYKKELNEKVDHDEADKRAGKQIIRNALFCFLKSLSAEDFVALNAKDYESLIQTLATKNDSKAQFFRYRNIVFDILSEKTKKFFQDIKDITVTLDKVTVHRVSYTVGGPVDVDGASRGLFGGDIGLIFPNNADGCGIGTVGGVGGGYIGTVGGPVDVDGASIGLYGCNIGAGMVLLGDRSLIFFFKFLI